MVWYLNAGKRGRQVPGGRWNPGKIYTLGAWFCWFESYVLWRYSERTALQRLADANQINTRVMDKVEQWVCWFVRTGEHVGGRSCPGIYSLSIGIIRCRVWIIPFCPLPVSPVVHSLTSFLSILPLNLHILFSPKSLGINCGLVLIYLLTFCCFLKQTCFSKNYTVMSALR